MTKHELEEQIANGIGKFHCEQQGRCPREVQAVLIRDMIVVRSTGIFTPIEDNLTTTEVGRKVVKSARRELRSIIRTQLHHQIAGMVGCDILSSFHDIDVRTGNEVEVYQLSDNAEQRLFKTESDGGVTIHMEN